MYHTSFLESSMIKLHFLMIRSLKKTYLGNNSCDFEVFAQTMHVFCRGRCTSSKLVQRNGIGAGEAWLEEGMGKAWWRQESCCILHERLSLFLSVWKRCALSRYSVSNDSFGHFAVHHACLQHLLSFVVAECCSCKLVQRRVSLTTTYEYQIEITRSTADLNWHCDNEPIHGPLDKPFTILSLSLGSKRVFLIQRKRTPQIIEIPMRPGDILVMTGLFQKEFLHKYVLCHLLDILF